MKFTTILSSLALSAVAVSAADSTLNVASVISAFYPTKTPSLAPAASTSLASALQSVKTSFENSPQWTSAAAAIISAAPSSAKASISSSGFHWAAITGQEWYTKSVDGAQRSVVAAQESRYDSVAAKIVGTATSTAAASRVTGAIGMVGVVGGVVMAGLGAL
ncbi:hypothetical protein B0J14DRAFT_680950 [Halenospora varia]|nr:hypothetical protein B0J14DRAFT_680950 [Halenospora varia]